MSDLLEILFLFVALSALLAIMILVLMHVYQILKEPIIQKSIRKLRKPVQPWVTVLLYSHFNEPLIEASLKALLRSQYHNFDIVVVKDYSNDSTIALKKAYKKSLKGKIIVSIQAGIIVPPAFLKRVVAMKSGRNKLTVRIIEQLHINSLTEVVLSLSNLISQSSPKIKISDVKNISVIKKPVRSDLIFAFLCLAIIVISVTIHEPVIIWYSWLIVTGYLLSTIWLKDEKIQTKVKLSFSAFSAFFMLPIASLIMKISQRHSRNLRI